MRGCGSTAGSPPWCWEMKKVGLIGGLGPEIAIESLDLSSFTRAAWAGDWEGITAILADRFELLRRGGADFGAIASNTPHRVFDKVQERTALPLLSIVEAARDHAVRLGVRKLCLLGTRFTMEADFYQRVFGEAGVRLIGPNGQEIEFGNIQEDTKSGFLAIIDRIRADQRTEGVILGCTELPLLLKPEDFSGQYIDTTAIHIRAIVRRCSEESDE
jgi:aspartate racemase